MEDDFAHLFLEKKLVPEEDCNTFFAGEDFGDLAFVEWNLDCRSVHAGRLRTESLRDSNCETSSWRSRMQSVEETGRYQSSEFIFW